MKFLRKHIIFLRFFWFLMGIHVLNFSIDSPDSHSDEIPEDLTYNDMESFVEIFLENILGFDNAIAEHDEDDSETGGSVDISKVIFLIQTTPEVFKYIPKECLYSISVPNSYKNLSFCSFNPEIIPPPPKIG